MILRKPFRQEKVSCTRLREARSATYGGERLLQQWEEYRSGEECEEQLYGGYQPIIVLPPVINVKAE